jgi:spermidine/putrescine transport system substrate-binding protein
MTRLFVAVTLLLGLLAAASSTSADSGQRELVFLNWSDYMDPALVEEFEKIHGVKVKQVYFETDDARTDLLLNTKGAGYDLIVCNDSALNAYVKSGWLDPVSADQIPNLKHIDPRWRGQGEIARYGVPYFWGTVGIGYRKDLVREPVTSWRALFQPAAALRGRIAMINDVRDTIGMALKTLGHSINNNDPKVLAQVERLLVAQRPFVKTYSYVSLGEDSALLTGQVWMAMMYNGDALKLREHNPNIAYVVPAEGTNLWVDYLAVLRNAPNKALARQFIDFMNEPRNAARLAQYVHYATPNLSAEKLLPAEMLADPVVYPPQAVLQRSEQHVLPSPRATSRRNAMFARLHAGGSTP